MTTSWSAPRRARIAGLSWREVGGEVIVLDTDASEYLSLNAVGSYLWSLLQDAVADPGTLVAAIVARYGVDEECASHDVDVFLAQCDAKRLLEEVTG